MDRFDVDYIDEERGCVHIYHDDGDNVLAPDALELEATITELTAECRRLEAECRRLNSPKKVEIEVRNAAYEIACSNSLTESITYDELQKISDEDLMAIAWEPFENWDASDLHCHIAQIARAIIDAFPARG